MNGGALPGARRAQEDIVLGHRGLTQDSIHQQAQVTAVGQPTQRPGLADRTPERAAIGHQLVATTLAGEDPTFGGIGYLAHCREPREDITPRADDLVAREEPRQVQITVGVKPRLQGLGSHF